MSKDVPLRPATRDDVLFTIARALNLNPVHDFTAKIAAKVVLDRIEASNMVIMQKPPAPPHTAGGGPDGSAGKRG